MQSNKLNNWTDAVGGKSRWSQVQGEDSGALGISWGGGRAKDKGSQVIVASHRQRPRTVQEGVARHGIPAS